MGQRLSGTSTAPSSVAEGLRAEIAAEGGDITRVFIPDDSGTSRSLHEMEAEGKLARYLDHALKAELLRLDRLPALWRQP